MEAASDPRPGNAAWWAHPHSQVLLLVGVGVIVLFLVAMLSATEGHFIPQVADLYLTCQYAKAMAEGHPFQYNPGEPYSTGATSLLHTAILAAAHAVGVRGEGLIAFAILLGAGLYLASIVLARGIGLRLGGEREGLLAGALVALGGPVVWGFLYGADVALFMFLALWLFERLLAEWDGGPTWHGTGVACLLALARPEGLALGLLLAGGWLLLRRGGLTRAQRWIIWLPVLAGLAVCALYRILTGYWMGTSVIDKSLLVNYGVLDSLALASEYLIDVVRGLLLGFYPSQAAIGFSRGWAPLALPPLALLLILLALAAPREQVARPLRLWAASACVVAGVFAPNMYMGVHFNRYLLWTWPALLVLTAVGLGSATRFVDERNPGLDRRLFLSGALTMLVLAGLATARFAGFYADLASELYRRDFKAAQWIAQNLPRGVGIANATTSVEYLTGHRNYNLYGVTSPAFFGTRKAEREAGVFEAFGRLPVPGRPHYLLSTAATLEANPALRELVIEPPLYQTNSLGDEIFIHRLSYDLVGKNRRLFDPEVLAAVAGLTKVDELNVCDSQDERSHGYSFVSHLGSLALNGTARIGAYHLADGRVEEVIDGGRAILGYESFRVTARAGRELVIVIRTAPTVDASVLSTAGISQNRIAISEAGLIVKVSGQVVLRSGFKASADWEERVLRIPGQFLTHSPFELQLLGRYASFYYWFFQS